MQADNVKLYTQDGKEICTFDCVDCELTTPSAEEVAAPVIHSLLTNQTAEFSADICGEYPSEFVSLSHSPAQHIYYDVPIMIQARWHKKYRINKKWLKRYGMKRDVVKMKAHINIIERIPNYKFNSFNFEIDTPVMQYRPDQMRRNLKIEFI